MTREEMRAWARRTMKNDPPPPLSEETKRVIRRSLKQCPPANLSEGHCEKGASAAMNWKENSHRHNNDMRGVR